MKPAVSRDTASPGRWSPQPCHGRNRGTSGPACPTGAWRWEEVTALTATGPSLVWFSSVLHSRAEGKPRHDSPASSPPPAPDPGEMWHGQDLYLHGKFPASLLRSRNLLPEAGSSCLPCLSIATARQDAPSSWQPLPPQARQDPRPPTTPHSRERSTRTAAEQGTPQHPAPSLPARHPLAFTQSGAGGSLRPGSIPVRVHKQLPVPVAAEVFSEKQCRLQARV